jgi:prepilin-type N-terminal cleavage/methylation domain-containing protein/prepilin-type processing-associated H-X9-DG protein
MLKRPHSKKGFTLIELLVVMAVISILLAILMPALKAAKRAGQAIVCASNLRSMSVAWMLYTDNDNRGRVPEGDPGEKFGWVRKPESSEQRDRIEGISKGVLFSYTQNPKLYHCPGDRRFSGKHHNYLSYSVPDCMGAKGTGEVRKREQISLPSEKYIFLEESDTRWYYSGAWSFKWKNDPDQGWWDGLAVWHNNASTFAFADGHAEIHKWKDKYTRFRASWDEAELAIYGKDGNKGNYGNFPWATHKNDPTPNTYNNQRNDLDWMIRHYPARGAK